MGEKTPAPNQDRGEQMQRLTRYVVRVALAVGACLVAAPAAQAAQLTVDDGAKTDCPNAGFTSIQAAVTAASAGDTISICPGTYVEGAGGTGTNGVNINKSLTIKGAGADLVTIKPNGADISDGTARNALGNVINVTAGPTSISGVTVDATGTTVDSDVVFLNASGSVTNSHLTGTIEALGPGVNPNGQAVMALSQLASGTFTFTLSGNLIDRYDKGGVVIDSTVLPGGSGLPSGSEVNSTISNNLIHGAGESTSNTQGQNGVQISGGAISQITGNTITANKQDAASPQDSAGILLYNEGTAAKYNAIKVHSNNIYSNGFGLLATETFNDDPPVGGQVDATANYWGSFDGPTPVTVATPPTQPPAHGDYVNLVTQGVTSSAFAQRPFAQGTLPVPEPDAAPNVAITSPADGTTVNPGTATAITATATDEIGVNSVVFRKGVTVLPTSGTGPTYSASYTPSAAEAGTSQVITATATDSKGQTSTSAISLGVASAPVTPPAPPDLRPNVAFTSPASGASIDPRGATTVSANATDDRGVASVAFVAGDRVICTDTTAPYSCQWQPNGADVGRTSLIAVVIDTAGQTSADIRTVRVQRFNVSSLSSSTSPKRDKKAPYRYTTSGKLSLPSAVSARDACGNGFVVVTYSSGRTHVNMLASLSGSCTYRTNVSFGSRSALARNGRIHVSARFLGSSVVNARSSSSQTVRAG